MNQININFFILMFYIFLRNVMVFDKELAILYGFNNFYKNYSSGKNPQRDPKHFFLDFLFDFISKCI